jgi:hypothetical protein
MQFLVTKRSDILLCIKPHDGQKRQKRVEIECFNTLTGYIDNLIQSVTDWTKSCCGLTEVFTFYST